MMKNDFKVGGKRGSHYFIEMNGMYISPEKIVAILNKEQLPKDIPDIPFAFIENRKMDVARHANKICKGDTYK